VSTLHSKVVDLLRLEASAVERAASQLEPSSIEKAIELLVACSTKVVIIGVGKSGVIAQKIAQTMTSTGTAAIYVHPSDALHGSLGMIGEGDVVIALSNSGETEEILAILPTIASRKVPVISIVGNLSSSLAKRSDVVLDASVDREACPHNLAPTTSTTVALSIGDAVSMVLMEAKGHSPEDFAANHPAGRLGKRLTLTVGDLMNESPNVNPDSDWVSVVSAISEFGLGAVNVTDDNGKLIGIITDGDLRRTIGKTDPSQMTSLSASEMMTKQPVTVTADLLAFDALRVMEERSSQISVLPVIDDHGNAIGLLRLHDIVKSGI
jgi:arabinose-5-phosphate isomerase